ncbi:MAG: DUF4350 domain-containing protein [Verrucomicrobiota bacterium]
MTRRRFNTWFGLIVLGLMLIVGSIEVIEKRIAEGGIYPHYASYRSDPLGVSALYESLSGIPGLRVERNITHLNSITTLDGDSALLLLGLPRESLNDLRATPDSPVIQAVKEGARLVVTVNPGLVPEKYQPSRTEDEEDWFERRRKLREERIRSENDGVVEEENDEEAEERLEVAMDKALGERLTRKLGFELESLEEFERPEGGWELKSSKRSPVAALPNWYSQFRFANQSKGWKVIARSEKKPAVIEKRYGKGTIVLASDSFFVSNEALHLEPVPEFLSWMVGGKSKIIFDETIHGSKETGGAMKLMRRYRIHGVFFGLFVFLGLWAWRTSSPLAPGDDDLDRGLVGPGGTVAGESMNLGLTRMLRTSIGADQLLKQCVAVWRESKKRALSTEATKEVEQLLSDFEGNRKSRDAVFVYRRIAECLRRH